MDLGSPTKRHIFLPYLKEKNDQEIMTLIQDATLTLTSSIYVEDKRLN